MRLCVILAITDVEKKRIIKD